MPDCKKNCKDEGKLCNKLSGRCVKKDGKIGKEILQNLKSKKSTESKKSIESKSKKVVKKSVNKSVNKSVKKVVKQSRKKKTCNEVDCNLLGKVCSEKTGNCIKGRGKKKEPEIVVDGGEVIVKDGKKPDVVIDMTEHHKKSKPSISPVVVSLERAFRQTSSRIDLLNQVLTLIPNKNPKQCLTNTDLKQFLKIIKQLGEGSFGNVFLGEIGLVRMAVKQGQIPKVALRKPYGNSYRATWEEINILKNIIRPMIENKVCPNLPLIYKEFYCPKCDFVFDEKKVKEACTINLVELASGGDLSGFLSSEKLSEEAVNVALFQVLAGIHALQKHGIFHNDIKGPNIIVYDVEPGGYYEYIIMGKHYFVPNIGKLFVINDFGVSISYMPKHPYGAFERSYGIRSGDYIDMAHRNVMIHDNTVVPFFVEERHSVRKRHVHIINFKGVNGAISKDRFLLRKGLLTTVNFYYKSEIKSKCEYYSYKTKRYESLTLDMFNEPEIIPPRSFAVDILDALFTFIGDCKRGSQPGNHEETKIPERIKTKLFRYTILDKSHRLLGLGGVKDRSDKFLLDFDTVKPYHYLAKYLFEPLFGGIFDKPHKGEIIETYKMS